MDRTKRLWETIRDAVSRWFGRASSLDSAEPLSTATISLPERAPMDSSQFAFELIRVAVQTVYLGGNKIHKARADDDEVVAREAIDISQEMGDLTGKIIDMFAQAVDSGADWETASAKLHRFYERLGDADAIQWLGLDT